MFRSTEKLKPNKWNSNIYGKANLDDAFLISIRDNGIREAIVIKPDGTIISGHRRWHAAKKLGISEVPVKIEVYEGEVQEREALIDYNRYRNKPFSQRMKEAEFVEETERMKARERQAHGKTAPGKNAGGNIATSDAGKTRDKVAEKIEMGSGRNYSKAKRVWEVANSGDVKCQEAIERIDRGELTINKAYNYIKRQEIKAAAKQVEPPRGKFRVVLADPPWHYGDKRDGKTTGAEDHYPSMAIEELCNLPVKELAEDNAVLFLWAPSPLLEECFAVINAWGFKYKTSFVWDKCKHNMGHYNSVRHEFLLVCTRGSCKPDKPKLYDSVQSIPRTEHSKKPEEFRQIIDDIYPDGKRIELFARNSTEGWEVWGNEV